jgi:hypothetical protein
MARQTFARSAAGLPPLRWWRQPVQWWRQVKFDRKANRLFALLRDAS